DAYLDASGSWSRADLSGTFGITPMIRLAAGSPDNPFQQDILVTTPMPAGLAVTGDSETQSIRGIAGVVVHLPKNWAATVEETWSHSSFEYEEQDTTLATRVSPAGLAFLGSNALKDSSGGPIDLTPYLQPFIPDYGGPWVSKVLA